MQTSSETLQGFPPIIASDPSLLILGSFPSSQSLETGMYYGHKRNHFWHILSVCLQEPYPATNQEKEQIILSHGLALWDVIKRCKRHGGSLDQNIRDFEINDIPGLLTQYPRIERILLNGSLAAAIFYSFFMKERHVMPVIGKPVTWKPDFSENASLVQQSVLVYRLPSTSPVPSRTIKTYQDKLPYWEAALTQN
ncbi:MAG: DNA-deoxyinosine glycosylase [Termitinemataceae bacterium]